MVVSADNVSLYIYMQKPEPSSREDGPGFLLNRACVLKAGTL